MFCFYHMNTQILKGIKRVTTEHTLENFLCIFLVHVLERPFPGLGVAGGSVLVLFVVVILVVPCLVHVHRELYQGVVGSAALPAAEPAGAREHSPAHFAALPVELHRAEQVGLGDRPGRQILLQAFGQSVLVPIKIGFVPSIPVVATPLFRVGQLETQPQTCPVRVRQDVGIDCCHFIHAVVCFALGFGVGAALGLLGLPGTDVFDVGHMVTAVTQQRLVLCVLVGNVTDRGILETEVPFLLRTHFVLLVRASVIAALQLSGGVVVIIIFFLLLYIFLFL